MRFTQMAGKVDLIKLLQSGLQRVRGAFRRTNLLVILGKLPPPRMPEAPLQLISVMCPRLSQYHGLPAPVHPPAAKPPNR